MPTAAKDVDDLPTPWDCMPGRRCCLWTANQFTSRITVFRQRDEDRCEVDGKSVMQMITLEATAGTRLRIRAEGDDAEAAVHNWPNWSRISSARIEYDRQTRAFAGCDGR